jgi:hypothetical protein
MIHYLERMKAAVTKKEKAPDADSVCVQGLAGLRHA